MHGVLGSKWPKMTIASFMKMKEGTALIYCVYCVGFLVCFLRLVEMSIHQTLIKRPEIVSVFCLTGFICCKLLPTSIDSQSQRAWGITVTCRSYRWVDLLTRTLRNINKFALPGNSPVHWLITPVYSMFYFIPHYKNLKCFLSMGS